MVLLCSFAIASVETKTECLTVVDELHMECGSYLENAILIESARGFSVDASFIAKVESTYV